MQRCMAIWTIKFQTWMYRVNYRAYKNREFIKSKSFPNRPSLWKMISDLKSIIACWLKIKSTFLLKSLFQSFERRPLKFMVPTRWLYNDFNVVCCSHKFEGDIYTKLLNAYSSTLLTTTWYLKLKWCKNFHSLMVLLRYNGSI